MTELEYRRTFADNFTAYGLVEANLDVFTDRFRECIEDGKPMNDVIDFMEATFRSAAELMLDWGDEQVSDDSYLAYREFAFFGWKAYKDGGGPRRDASALVWANYDRFMAERSPTKSSSGRSKASAKSAAKKKPATKPRSTRSRSAPKAKGRR